MNTTAAPPRWRRPISLTLATIGGATLAVGGLLYGGSIAAALSVSPLVTESVPFSVEGISTINLELNGGDRLEIRSTSTITEPRLIGHDGLELEVVAKGSTLDLSVTSRGDSSWRTAFANAYGIDVPHRSNVLELPATWSHADHRLNLTVGLGTVDAFVDVGTVTAEVDAGGLYYEGAAKTIEVDVATGSASVFADRAQHASFDVEVGDLFARFARPPASIETHTDVGYTAIEVPTQGTRGYRVSPEFPRSLSDIRVPLSDDPKSPEIRGSVNLGELSVSPLSPDASGNRVDQGDD